MRLFTSGPTSLRAKMRLTRLLASLQGLKPLCIDQNFSVFKRTLDHLHSWQLVLPASVKRATYHLCVQEKEKPDSPHWGAWMFLYENVPQLKYHNSSVPLNVERHSEGDSRIELLSEDGKIDTLVTTGLKQTGIKEQLEAFFNS